MRPGKIDQLVEVLDVLFAREHQVISEIIARESILRNKLIRLDEQITQNRNACANNHLLQAVGAQLLWQGWTTRTHRQLNTELAQVMATKLAAMDRVRTAFGRQRAVSLLQSAEYSSHKKRCIRQMEINLLSSATVDSVMYPGE